MSASTTADRASGDRPSLESARKAPFRVWILQEWGLILLAAVLAIILWEVTSTRVIRELRITGVRVLLDVSDDDQKQIGAVLSNRDETVTIEMTCSERERFAVLAALTKTGGGTPALRLKVSPRLEGAKRPFDLSIESWLWPVDNAAELGMRVPKVPVGTVYRIEGMQQVHIAKPRTIPDAAGLAELGYKILITDPDSEPPVDIRLDHAFMEFLAPRAVFSDTTEGGLSMEPDPIDLNAILASEAPPLGKPQTFSLTFNQWRSAHPYRSRLGLQKVTATLTLYRPADATFKNRMEVLLHPQFEWAESSAKPDFTPGPPYEFKGTLSGPQWILDEIAKDLAGWMWQMWIAEPSDGWPVSTMVAADEWKKNVPARIEWVPLRPEWKNKGVRFVPKENSGEDGFTVKIKRRTP